MKEKIINKIKEVYKEPKIINNPAFYLYDMEEIAKCIHRIKESAPDNIKLYYSMKANPNKDILSFMSKNSYVKGIEIASTGELRKALKYYSSKDILFTGPGKTEAELEEAISNQIKLINVESIVEVFRIDHIVKKLKLDKVDILLRINIDYCVDGAKEYMAGCSTKMGIDEKEIIKAYQYILSEFDTINIKGVHVFSASGVIDYRNLIKYVEYVFNMVQKLENSLKININIVDFGGGIGIDYDKAVKLFDMFAYMQEINNLIKKYGFEEKDLILELGTYLVGSCGYYTSKIIDIKDIKNRKHIVLAGGVNHLRLPIASGQKQPVEIINIYEKKYYKDQPVVIKELADIEGPLCMDEDKISWDEYIEYANIGDYVVIRQAGAYGYTASTLEFLSHDLPEEIIVS